VSGFAIALVASTVFFFGFAGFNLLRLPHVLSAQHRYQATPLCAEDVAGAELIGAAGGSCRARVTASITAISGAANDGSPDTLVFLITEGPRVQADVPAAGHDFAPGQRVTLEVYRGSVMAVQTSYGWIATTNHPDAMVQDAWSFPFLILAGAMCLIPTVFAVRGFDPPADLDRLTGGSSSRPVPAEPVLDAGPVGGQELGLGPSPGDQLGSVAGRVAAKPEHRIRDHHGPVHAGLAVDQHPGRGVVAEAAGREPGGRRPPERVLPQARVPHRRMRHAVSAEERTLGGKAPGQQGFPPRLAVDDVRDT
jgi:hypothetical protein